MHPLRACELLNFPAIVDAIVFLVYPSPFSSSRHLYLVLLLLVLTLTPFLLPGLHLCLPSCATSHPVHSLLKCFTTYDLRFAVRGEVVVIISIG